MGRTVCCATSPTICPTHWTCTSSTICGISCSDPRPGWTWPRSISSEVAISAGTLNETRIALGLKPYTSFAAITSDAATAAALKAAYGDVNNVELWIGGLAENHLPGAMVGPTFDLIISQRFQNLRDGDRLWYQNQGFDQATLRDIRSTTLSSLILKNTDIQHMQADAFVFYGGAAVDKPAAG